MTRNPTTSQTIALLPHLLNDLIETTQRGLDQARAMNDTASIEAITKVLNELKVLLDGGK